MSLAVLLWSSAAAAASPPLVLQLGVMAPYGIQPGLRLGARQRVRTWAGPRSEGALLLGGDVAGYAAPGDHISGLAGVTAGARWQREGGFAVAVEGGLALTADRQRLGARVDLATGALEPEHEWRLWLLPTVTGRLSWRGDRPLGLYTGLAVGPQLGFGRDGALSFTADAGVRIRLGAGGDR